MTHVFFFSILSQFLILSVGTEDSEFTDGLCLYNSFDVEESDLKVILEFLLF